MAAGEGEARPLRIAAARAFALALRSLPLAYLLASLPTASSAQLTEFCPFTGDPGPCRPTDQPYDTRGQELRLTLVLTPQGARTEPPAAAAPAPPRGKLNTIREVFGALRSCFSGALGAAGPRELSATIRFSFTRQGEILGEPRFTYVQSDLPADTRQAFERDIGHALVACMPLPFTDGLGGALAGRPFSIRIVKPAKPATRS